MKKYTTDDLHDPTGRIDRTSQEELKDARRRIAIYGLLGLLMLALALHAALQGMMWEALFALILAAVFLYWSYFIYSRLRQPQVVVFLRKGDTEYHYDPKCFSDRPADLDILTERRAQRKGLHPCPKCRDHSLNRPE